MGARKLSVVESIQARPRKGGKPGSTAALQAKSLKKAHRIGVPWDTDEVGRLVAGISRDETSYDIAIALGRSYYGTMGARAHVAFAMRHSAALFAATKKGRK